MRLEHIINIHCRDIFGIALRPLRKPFYQTLLIALMLPKIFLNVFPRPLTLLVGTLLKLVATHTEARPSAPDSDTPKHTPSNTRHNRITILIIEPNPKVLLACGHGQPWLENPRIAQDPIWHKLVYINSFNFVHFP
jgi:hypothetical protein